MEKNDKNQNIEREIQYHKDRLMRLRQHYPYEHKAISEMQQKLDYWRKQKPKGGIKQWTTKSK